MKTRFMVTTICLVLVFAVLPLAAFSQGGGGLFKPVSAAPMSITKPETPIVVNPSITSPYDGTYAGMFNYEYRENRLEKVPPHEYLEVVYGEWTPAAFGLTVTLKTVKTGYESFIGIVVDVTSVTGSDQNFGTGLSGVIPVPEKSGGVLPLDPPTTPMNPSKPGQGIVIYFPNGAAFLNTVTFPINAGELSVSPGGQTLSGSAFYAETLKGPLSKERLVGSGPVREMDRLRYDVHFKSWSLTRIAYTGLTTTTEPPVSPPTKLKEEAVLTGIAGEVEVRKGGAGEWTKYDQTGLKPGDEIATGYNGKGTIEFSDGGRRKGNRGRGAAGKVPVFGVLERDGKVFVNVVPNMSAESIMGTTVKKVKRGSIVYTDKWRGYDSLMFCGYRHMKLDHSKQFASGKVHINGMEGFRSYAKERLIKHHGVSKQKFPLYIKEMEFRYNNRNKEIYETLLKYITDLVAKH